MKNYREEEKDEFNKKFKGYDEKELTININDVEDDYFVIYQFVSKLGSASEWLKPKSIERVGKISYTFDMRTGSNTVKCEGPCGMYSRGHGDTSCIPNCVKFFGEVYTTG